MLAGSIVFLTIVFGLMTGILAGWAALALVLHAIDWSSRPAKLRSPRATQKLPAVEPQPVA